MSLKTIGIIFGILLILVVVGGVGYKIVSPSSKTVVEKGGKLTQLFTDKPQIPLVGCSISRINLKAYYEKGFPLHGNDDVKK